MRTVLVLFCLVLSVVAFNSSTGSLLKKIECNICYDIVKDTEQWIGSGEERDEKTILDRCDKFFEWFKAKAMQKRFCDNLLKNGLDAIIHRMEDAGKEGKDAAAICGDLHACPQQCSI